MVIGALLQDIKEIRVLKDNSIIVYSRVIRSAIASCHKRKLIF